MKWAKDAQGMKWAEEAQGMEWVGPAGMLASKAQKKKECRKWTGRSFST